MIFKRIKVGVYTQLLLETDQIFILNDSLNEIKRKTGIGANRPCIHDVK